MRRLSVALIAAASTIAFGQIASAADLGRPVYKAPPPPPPPVSDWSGVYVGLEGGYGWGEQSLNGVSPGDCWNCDLAAVALGAAPQIPVEQFIPLFFPDVNVGSVKQRGGLFGGFFGVQKQWGSWVLGLEGDIDGASIKGSASSSAVSDFDFFTVHTGPAFVCEVRCGSLTHSVLVDSKTDMLGSMRGKVGFVPAPDWLIYGTGGLAFAHVKTSVTSTESVALIPDLTRELPSGTFSSQNALGGTTMSGWAAGAGIDWKLPLDAGSALVFGVEYLHYDFPEQTITLADNAGSSFAFNAKEHVDTVKGRISYLFSIH